MKRQVTVNVIGAGLGGLSTAAILAKHGVKVRVFERLKQVGGVVHSFKRGKYTFEASTHQIGGLGDIGYLEKSFGLLGISDLEVVRAPFLYEACYVDGDGKIESRYRLPSRPDALLDVLGRSFPEEKEKLGDFLDTVERIGKDVLRLKRVQREMSKLPVLVDAITALMLKNGKEGSLIRKIGMHAYRHMIRHFNLAFSDMLVGFSPRLKSILSQYWTFAGTPPSEAPAVLMAIILYIYLFGGPYLIRGGTKNLVDRLAGAVTGNGGEILMRAPIGRIVVEGGAAKGVVTVKGDSYPSDYTVSNISSYRTFVDMVGEDKLPREYVERIKRIRLSHSAFQTFVGAPFDLREYGLETSTTFFNFGDDVEECYRACAGGPTDRTTMMVTNYTMEDRSYAPEGCNSFVIIEFDSFARWKDLDTGDYEAEKARTQGLLLDKFERITGAPVREKARHVFSGTPRTFQRYSSSIQGEIYGPAATLDQTFTKRTEAKTPVENLLLVGAYSQPAQGVSAVIDSGVILGNTLLEEIS